jgi:hypothetical protein
MQEIAGKSGDSKNSAVMYEYKNMVFDVISDNFCSLLITRKMMRKNEK